MRRSATRALVRREIWCQTYGARAVSEHGEHTGEQVLRRAGSSCIRTMTSNDLKSAFSTVN